MPYIITTRHDSKNPHPLARQADSLMPRTSTAVATLEEARVVIRDSVVRAGVPHGTTADPVTPAGGTIGPLPDGTVIAVRATDWIELAGLAGWTLDRMTRERLRGRTRQTDRDALLAAFNA